MDHVPLEDAREIGAWNRASLCQPIAMNDVLHKRLDESVRAWRRAGPALEEMRHEDIRRSGAKDIAAVIPTAEMMERLGVVLSAETGLVKQQAWFAKVRHG